MYVKAAIASLQILGSLNWLIFAENLVVYDGHKLHIIIIIFITTIIIVFVSFSSDYGALF